MAHDETEADKGPEMDTPQLESSSRQERGYWTGASSVGSPKESAHCKEVELMTAVVERTNMLAALHQVERNRGSAGVDGMTIAHLRPWLREHWAMIKAKLLEGSYQPRAIRRVAIPKPGGGERILGIPTVVDRLIQQAIGQVLVPIYDPHFSDHSYGFRPGRSAVQAVRKAQAHQHDGRRWVVDLDLEKFFDFVNHDILLARLRRRVADPVLLSLIGRYLRAGMMEGEIETTRTAVVRPRTQGTPQGGPLSPLLSNILLDDFDKELEKRGHSFVRYADDANIYVSSEKAGHRVLESVTSWLAKRLKLKVNVTKSEVARPWTRKFLGYSVTNHRKAKLRVAPESVKRLKGKVKEHIRRGRGRNLKRFIEEDLNPVLRGWSGYFAASETRGIFDELDQWIRRKLRNIVWRQWKRPRTRRKKLMSLGLDEATASASAYNGRGAWWNSGASHMNRVLSKKYFDQIGLVNLQERVYFLEKASFR